MDFAEWKESLTDEQKAAINNEQKAAINKYVDNSDKRGIIKEKSNKSVTLITDASIDNVPQIKIPGFSDEQSMIIQKYHKDLLRYSRKENECREVAFILDSNLNNIDKIEGGLDDVDISGVIRGKDLFVLHNHPKNSSFSDLDIGTFISYDNIKAMSIVKNNGVVEIIKKSDNYTQQSAMIYLRRAYKKCVVTQTEKEIDTAIKTFLNKNGGCIEWIRK